MSETLTRLRKFLEERDANASVEFVLVVPLLILMMVFGVSAGTTMLRQTSLDRSVDIVVRDLRLGRYTSGQGQELREAICANTFLITSCNTTLTIQMHPLNVGAPDFLQDQTLCFEAEEEFNPVIEFNPGAGVDAQEVMILRACITAQPLLRIPAFYSTIPANPDGELVLISHAIFVNEPRD